MQSAYYYIFSNTVPKIILSSCPSSQKNTTIRFCLLFFIVFSLMAKIGVSPIFAGSCYLESSSVCMLQIPEEVCTDQETLNGIYYDDDNCNQSFACSLWYPSSKTCIQADCNNTDISDQDGKTDPLSETGETFQWFTNNNCNGHQSPEFLCSCWNFKFNKCDAQIQCTEEHKKNCSDWYSGNIWYESSINCENKQPETAPQNCSCQPVTPTGFTTGPYLGECRSNLECTTYEKLNCSDDGNTWYSDSVDCHAEDKKCYCGIGDQSCYPFDCNKEQQCGGLLYSDSECQNIVSSSEFLLNAKVTDLQLSSLLAINPLKNSSIFKDPANRTPGFIINRALTVVVFPVAGYGLLILILWSGFQILTGSVSGKQNSIDIGKKRLTTAIIGFVILLLVYWIWRFLTVATGLMS